MKVQFRFWKNFTSDTDFTYDNDVREEFESLAGISLEESNLLSTNCFVVYVDYEDGRGYIPVDAKVFDLFRAVYDGSLNSDGWSEYLCGYCNRGFGGIEAVEGFEEIEDMFDGYPYYM